MGDFQVDVFEPLRKIDGLLVVVKHCVKLLPSMVKH